MTARVLRAPRIRQITPEEGIPATFVQHASREAIKVQLDGAREKVKRWDRLAERLEALLAERDAQIAAGEWPRPKSGREARAINGGQP